MMHTANQDLAIKAVKNKDVDWIFVTDETMPNPYDGSAKGWAEPSVFFFISSPGSHPIIKAAR